MISGIHAIVYSRNAERVRGFFRDVLALPSVDAGRGWLIFALPPAELAVHPSEGEAHHELYLMCDDVHSTVERLAVEGVELLAPIADRGWGLVTRLKIPGGDEIGLYQPKHPTALHIDSPHSGSIRKYFSAYENRDRDALESLLTGDFTFTSPYDHRIDRETYFKRCWPYSELSPIYTVEKLFEKANQAFILYSCKTKDRGTARNTEFFTFEGNKIKEIEVYFGSMPDPITR